MISNTVKTLFFVGLAVAFVGFAPFLVLGVIVLVVATLGLLSLFIK